MQDYVVFDIESDGLLDSITKIHCLSYQKYSDSKLVDTGTLTEYEDLRMFFITNKVLVGHNIVIYDIPAAEKILDIKINCTLIDTLALSWYLFPVKIKHGLEQWGNDLGVKKPEIKDWINLDIEDYIQRCETDVVINTLLYHKQLEYLNIIYSNNQEEITNLIRYLVFKLDCAREQEEVQCKINTDLARVSLQELFSLRDEKLTSLISNMPKSIGYKEVSKPSKMYKKDGTLSSVGIKWLNLLAEEGLPQEYDEVVTVKISEENGNPASTIQLKNWLVS